MHFHDTDKCFNTQMCMLQSSNFHQARHYTFTTLRSNQINSRDSRFKNKNIWTKKKHNCRLNGMYQSQPNYHQHQKLQMSSKLHAFVTTKVYLLTPFLFYLVTLFNYWIGPDIHPSSKSSCVQTRIYIPCSEGSKQVRGVIWTLFLTL